MWWTAITFAAVAAWFEWVYRHDRKAPKAEEALPVVPASDESPKHESHKVAASEPPPESQVS